MDAQRTLNRDMYKALYLIRRVEEEIARHYPTDDIKSPVHLSIGQEAVAVGVCQALRDVDVVFGTYRGHAMYLAKGGDLSQMIAELYGKETGCARGRGGSMHLIDREQGVLGTAPIVGGTISLALGSALASTIRKDNRVTVSFFGDGAVGEGVLYESLNFASLHKLPVIFVCENNLYSTHMPIRECRTHNNIHEIAEPFGITGFRIDGNDVLKVYDAATEAVASCRNGEGPVFLECMTYRLHGHVGPDDNVQGTHTDIRPVEEIETWKRRDPVKLFERFLLEKDIASGKALADIRKASEIEVSDAHAFARDSSYPDKKEVKNYIFREMKEPLIFRDHAVLKDVREKSPQEAVPQILSDDSHVIAVNKPPIHEEQRKQVDRQKKTSI